MRTSSAARPLPLHPKRATRPKATMHINHPSLSKLSQTVRELVEKAQALLQNAIPPHSSKTRKEEVSKQPGNKHQANSSSRRLNSRRNDETRLKEGKYKQLPRFKLRQKSLHSLTRTRNSSSLLKLSKVKLLLMSTRLQLRKR